MSQHNQYPVTVPNLQPQTFELGGVNARPEVLSPNRLSVHDLSQSPAQLDLVRLPLLDENTGLAGIINAGGVPIKIYVEKDVQGNVNPNRVAFTAADYDDQAQVTDQAIKIKFLDLSAAAGTVNFGREERGAGRLGLSDKKVSRHHFSASINEGILNLTDLKATNGTSLILSSETVSNAHSVKLGRHLGHLAANEAVVVPSPEFSVNNFTYKVEAAIPTDGRGDIYVVNSSDKKGRTRQFLVYRSVSEGGWRSSQGYEIDQGKKRLMKGAELSSHAQYTQDTQLNPEFSSKLLDAVTGPVGLPLARGEDFMHDSAHAEALLIDFEAEHDVYSISDKRVASLLSILPAGSLSTENLRTHLDSSADLMNYVAVLNEALEQSDIMPDFSGDPLRTETDTHPILGAITREVYVKSGIEWHIGQDKNSRVWIDRVRIAKNETTSFGTDKDLIYSGILTSKPVEYTAQATGIPQSLRNQINSSYTDTAPFLANLAPIKKYKAQKTR